jgi:Domain of unknown function (DUF4111)
MDQDEMLALTPYPDVNAILGKLVLALPAILGENLAGFYLTGSLTYGDFDDGSSDIDYLVVLQREIDASQRHALKRLHAEVASRFPEWRERIEGSYVTRDMLTYVLPPPQGRPYVNQGAFWDPDPPYGNEWLINLYALRERGIAMVGPPPDALFPPVDIRDVREASRRDLLEEWLPQLNDPAFPPDAHHEAYVTLTMCRILHRARHDGVASKRVASAWVKERYGEPWRSLVEKAERWRHGEEMGAHDEVRAFVRFVARELAARAGS